MPYPPLIAPRHRFRAPRRLHRRAVLLGLLLAGILVLPTAAQALETPPASVVVRADSAPAPMPAPGVSPAPGPVPSPEPGPSPNPTPGPGGGSGSGSGGGGSGSSKGGGGGNLPAPQPMPSPPGSSSSGPSWWDIPGQVEHAIDQWFGDLAKAALTPIMNLIGKTVLSNPDTTGGRTGQLWTAALVIANTCYVLFAVVGGVIVMTHETVQTRYALGQIAPRLVLGLIAANTSLVVIGKAIGFANALTQAIWGQPLDPAGIGNKLLGYIIDSIFTPDGITQIFLVLFGLVLAVLAGAVLFSAALRTAALMLLTFSAPLALSCHALPGLDAIAKLWWRCFAAVFAIQILQALTLILALQTFFDPDGDVLGVPTSAGFTDLLVCGALFVILLKIPGWVLRVALGRQPRTGAMGMLKAAAAAALGTAIGVPGVASTRMLAGRFTGRMLRGMGPGTGGGGGAGGRGGGGGNPGGGPGPRAPRGPRPTPHRPARPATARPARPNVATPARPAPGGQPPLLPPPPGNDPAPTGSTSNPVAGATPAPANPPGAIPLGRAMPAPVPATTPPPWISTPASGPMAGPPRLSQLPPPPGGRFRTAPPEPTAMLGPARPGPGRWLAPLPPGGRPPTPPPLHTLRARKQPLFRVPPERRVPRTPTPAPPPPPIAPSPSPVPYRQQALFPRTIPVRLPAPTQPPPKPVKRNPTRATKEGR